MLCVICFDGDSLLLAMFRHHVIDHSGWLEIWNIAVLNSIWSDSRNEADRLIEKVWNWIFTFRIQRNDPR